ncbi:TetR/AcrR family transcriptional regulator [Kibdelosporangium aridum]|uniref:TetR/AcrR family transcriptional regulator n=1 Tax=Kibdelosporangium aridum TaxID=2030 RepID=A0A428Z4P3_KIBAR|nr:TetR/AcrR family transcriptional regulator [Kibdelosporangium aridum]RSM81572.1 TetR/AcrR family transcriptional regulator [Kibdelosporangium aridum]
MRERGDRRADIVRAAFRQVAEVGFEGLRLRQIAEEVGIDHSTVHHHFPGKKDIVAGVAEYAIGLLGEPPTDTLHGYLTHLRELMASSPEVFVVTAELDLRARRDPVVRTVVAEHEANWRRSLRPLLAHRESAIDLVIAVVKGVQLSPATAEAAFTQLEAMLTTDKT